jgi:hypothetical protein
LTKAAIFEAAGTVSCWICIPLPTKMSQYDDRQARYVATGMRQALDAAKPQEVAHSRENNRNDDSCRFQR